MLKEGQYRNPSGCAVSAVIDRSGKPMSGRRMIDSIAVMHERSNGLGGGFAGYGIYPDHKEFYAFHLFFDDRAARKRTEEYTSRHVERADGSE